VSLALAEHEYRGEYKGCPSDKVLGAKVVNAEGKDIGKISDLAIDRKSGEIRYAVLDFGGFLGIGEKHFAIPWEALTPLKEDRVRLNITKEELEQAEGFDDDHWPLKANIRWAASTQQANRIERTRSDANMPPLKLSKMLGEQVINNADEKLGKLDDVVIDGKQSQIAYAVVDCSAFLDYDEKLVAVPWTKLNVMDEKTIKLDASTSFLQTAPRFSDKNRPAETDSRYVVEVYRFYNVEPYWTVRVDTDDKD
jgi:sporulation protein YlmC with PRC-barrel domain